MIINIKFKYKINLVSLMNLGWKDKGKIREIIKYVTFNNIDEAEKRVTNFGFKIHNVGETNNEFW
jgi:hypothetical protein